MQVKAPERQWHDRHGHTKTQTNTERDSNLQEGESWTHGRVFSVIKQLLLQGIIGVVSFLNYENFETEFSFFERMFREDGGGIPICAHEVASSLASPCPCWSWPSSR